MERRISPRNQASSHVFSICSEGTNKTTPASGGRLVFAFGCLRGPELQASLPAKMWAITQRCDQVLRHQNRSGALERCGPLPPRASSIDLKDSEHLVQPDHDTSSDVGARPCLLRSAEHLCSTPGYGGRVKRPMSCRVIKGYSPDGRGSGPPGQTFSVATAPSVASAECAIDRGSGAERPSRRATTT